MTLETARRQTLSHNLVLVRGYLDRCAPEGRAKMQGRPALLLVQRHLDPELRPGGATRSHNVPPPTMGRVMGRK